MSLNLLVGEDFLFTKENFLELFFTEVFQVPELLSLPEGKHPWQLAEHRKRIKETFSRNV